MTDSRVTALTSLSAPTRDDLFYIVNNPAGAATSHKATVQAVIGGPMLYVAAVNASTASIKNADYVCDGINDEIEIQSAINALPASGGIVWLSEGDFTTGAIITLIDNLLIEGCGPATHITGTISASDTNYGIFYTVTDLSYCRIRNMRLTRASGGMGGIVSFNGGSTAEYIGCGIYNIIGYSENESCFTYSAGEGFDVIGCELRGSEITNSNTVEIGHSGKPRFIDCKIISASTPATAYGLLFTDNGGGLFQNCYIEGKNYGILATTSSNPRFIDCEIVTTHSVPVSVQFCAAPIFESCFIHPKTYSALFTYVGVNQIAAIVAGKAYRILSMHVRVDVAQPGITMDIGSSFGGNEIANNVDLSSTGARAITPPWDELFAADAPIYLTPSGPIANACLRIMYSILLDLNQASLYLTTTGNARFVNCYVLGSPGGTYLTNNETQFLNCVIECPDTTKYVVNYSAGSVAHFRDCTLIGARRNVNSFAYENSGTGTISNGTTSEVIAHGLAGTPTIDNVTITLAENPDNTPGAIWVDTIGAANFTVNCENNPGASNLDFGWRAKIVT